VLFVAKSRIPASAAEVFQWHADPRALERLTPPWEPLLIEQPARGIQNGDRGVLRVRVGPFWVRWRFEHCNYVEGRQFQDIQVSGPFRKWEHTHVMTPDGANACLLEDRIEYELPLGLLGQVMSGWYIRRKLQRMFEYRHALTKRVMAERRPKTES
jgi:ligand-binding SRPBCC domain-containing protein